MNKRLLMLNGLAILAVAINHATNSGYIAMFWWTDRYRAVAVPNFDQMGSFSYFFLVFLQKLTIFCVPTFLFTTGMFLAYAARGSQTRVSWEVIKRRVLNLLPPYAIWTIAFFAVEFILGDRGTILDYALRFIRIETSPFFFIPLVIVYYLISPFLVRIAKSKPSLLLILGGLFLLMGVVRGYLNYYVRANHLEETQFATLVTWVRQDKIFEYFFYYVLGIVIGFNQLAFKTWINKYKWMLLAGTIFAGLLAVVEAEWVFRTQEFYWRSRTLTLPSVIYCLAFNLTFLAFDQVKIPLSKFLYGLSDSTLGIYLTHKSVLLIAPKIAYNFLPFILGHQILFMPFLVTLAIGIPLLMMALTQKLPVRTYYRFLFG